LEGFDLGELRYQFQLTVERIARDSRPLLPKRASLWEPGILQRPTVCTGSANPLAEQLRTLLSGAGNLIAVIDDAKVGGRANGVAIVATRDLAALRQRYPNLLLLNAAMMESGRAHFSRVASILGLDCVNSLEYQRVVREVAGVTLTSSPDAPLLMIDDSLAFLDTTVEYCDEFLKLEELWSDELSAVTMYHLLLHRLNFDPMHLARASVGGYMAAPGHNSYIFDTSLFSFTDTEHFVDGGAYRGESFEYLFPRDRSALEGSVHAFEPDPVNMAYCRAKALELCGSDFESRIRLDPSALWEGTGTLQFAPVDYMGRVGSHVLMSNANSSSGPVVSVVGLDEVLDRPPTFIKLEVEGAETWALRGAVRNITRHRPKLCVGIYHRPLDLLHVARFIEEVQVGYRIFLRHHVPTGQGSTACYAVPD
jgi:FkbM family methyltransferase